MVQIDIPAAFVASMLFLDVGRKTVEKESGSDASARPAVYYRFLFRAVLFAGVGHLGLRLAVGRFRLVGAVAQGPFLFRLQHQVGFQGLLDLLTQLQCRELQQLDGLLQLRCHGEMLSEAKL